MAFWKTFSTASRLVMLLLGTKGHKLKVVLSKVQNKKTVVLHTGHSNTLEVLDTGYLGGLKFTEIQGHTNSQKKKLQCLLALWKVYLAQTAPKTALLKFGRMFREITTLYLPHLYNLPCVPSVAAVRDRMLSCSCLVHLQCSPIFIFSLFSITVHASSVIQSLLLRLLIIFLLLSVGIQSRQDQVMYFFSAPVDLGCFVITSFLLSLVDSSLTFLSFSHSSRADYFFQEAEILFFSPLVPLLVNQLTSRKSCCNSLTLPGNKPFLSPVTFPVSTLFICSRKSAFLKLCW